MVYLNSAFPLPFCCVMQRAVGLSDWTENTAYEIIQVFSESEWTVNGVSPALLVYVHLGTAYWYWRNSQRREICSSSVWYWCLVHFLLSSRILFSHYLLRFLVKKVVVVGGSYYLLGNGEIFEATKLIIKKSTSASSFTVTFHSVKLFKRWLHTGCFLSSRAT